MVNGVKVTRWRKDTSKCTTEEVEELNRRRERERERYRYQARLKRLIENGELPEYATVIPPHLDVGDAAAAAPAP